MPNDTGGPYLVAALICERVLHEADGVNSIIRVIDRFTIEGGKEAPGGLDDKHVASLDFSLYVSLKNGRAAGNHRLKVVPVRPDMSNPEPFEQVVHLESGEERGVNIVFPAPTDICEHLALLRELASKCDHVTEMGSRWMNGSTA